MATACFLQLVAPCWATVLRVNGMHADGEVSLLTAAALSSLMQSDQGDDCPPLVLEAVMGHGGSSGHAFIPGAVLFSLSEIDVCLEDDTGSPLPIAGNYCLRLTLTLNLLLALASALALALTLTLILTLRILARSSL